MKPTPFGYVKAASLPQALDLLARHGEEAQILAGGQSLIPTLNMRLSAPRLLIDISGLADLSGIAVAGDILRIGALTRHAEVEKSELVARHAPLIAAAMPHVAHPAIRNRGTFGGSLALADPAAELPACCLALAATMIVQAPSGSRRIAARDFFKGLFETALEAGEVLTAIEIPIAVPGQVFAFEELARRHGDYAIVGIAATARKAADGTLSDIRLAYLNLESRPVLAGKAAAALAGTTGDAAAVTAAQDALAGEASPHADLNATPETRLHLARVLLGRAVARLIA
ncbi:FAD binding domain-containing protein [Oceanibaculum pacificum]|uniref:Molybdopterin dehydrogenase n=1 Tax=Oceanibaculum pacificum TaxID=580166 RepID=A0A154VFA8_9PROT|nr:FAD binding domain-containing protein [Oceanibaculum pacificum]KZD00006.1 molybdopterin dehydrogenase [Oceanibaculum pacificum]